MLTICYWPNCGGDVNNDGCGDCSRQERDKYPVGSVEWHCWEYKRLREKEAMQPKWTPGPWMRKRPDANGELIEIGFAECDADDYGRARWSFEPVATVADTSNEEANASLIEAAPDLYEALDMCARVIGFDLRKMIVFGADYNQAVKDAHDKARAALAKAGV